MKPNPIRAGHGYRNELHWASGQGRQPYANRGEVEAAQTNCGDAVACGDRGARSGVNLEQMRLAKRQP